MRLEIALAAVGSLFFLGFLATATAAQSPSIAADVLLVRGHIYTSNPAEPWAESVAVGGDKILAVGSDAALKAYQGKNTKMIDLGGRMAMPGIIDTHTHFLWGSYGLTGVLVDEAHSVDEVTAKLRAFARTHPAETWVYGAGWPYGAYWATGLPTKDLLDAVFPDKPASLLSGDGHSLWVNSKALALAGITKDTANPTGARRGTIVRDSKTGEPTGVLEEGAKILVNDVMAKYLSKDEQFRKLRVGMEFANQHGVTSVVNATGGIPELELYAELHKRGELTVRMTTAFAEDVGIRHTLSAEELAKFEEGRRRFHDDWVRAGVIKFFADGVIETNSAAMLAPYANKPGEKGAPLYTQEEMRQYFLELDHRGFQVMTHAIGDAAVRQTLDAYEAVMQADGPRDRRWRIEHMEATDAADRPRLAKLGVLAAIQPWCCPQQGDPVWAANVGPGRMSEGLRWRDIVTPARSEKSATLIMGSDWPVESLDPFPILQIGLTRRDPLVPGEAAFTPDQALTLNEMLAGYTRNAAYGEFMEDRVGSLAAGKLADIVVLSQDLYKTPAEAVGNTTVLLTIVGGKVVWRKGL
jgi:predicted amidohydrolase YtcJ